MSRGCIAVWSNVATKLLLVQWLFSSAAAAQPGPIDAWRHAVLLRTVDDQSRAFCSGVVVAPNRVLTAKHCLPAASANGDTVGLNFVLEFGVQDGVTTQVARPVRVMPYPGDGRLFPLFDLSLVEFSGGLPSGVEPASIADVNLSRNTPLTVIGFGREGKAHAGQVQYQDTLNGDRVHGLMIARTPEHGGPCFGDSGGGVYAHTDGRWSLVGLVAGSWDALGDGLRRCHNSLMVMTDLRVYSGWLGLAAEHHSQVLGVPPTLARHGAANPLDLKSWCERDDFTSESWITIQGLIANVAGRNDSGSSDPDVRVAARPFLSCADANARLVALTSESATITLTTVRDLGPLRFLPHLTSLVLTDASIADWDTLKDLKHLKSLTVIGHECPVPIRALLGLRLESLSLQYTTLVGTQAEVRRLKLRRGTAYRKVSFVITRT